MPWGGAKGGCLSTSARFDDIGPIRMRQIGMTEFRLNSENKLFAHGFIGALVGWCQGKVLNHESYFFVFRVLNVFGWREGYLLF